MAFTNFCCRSGGSNLNAGTRTGDTTEPGTSPDISYTGGSWTQSTRVFAPNGANPVSDGVAVGDYASVFNDGASVGVFIGRVTARDSTTITISGTASSGTAPTDGVNNRSLRIGGAFAGPNGSSGYPISLLTYGPKNASGHPVRLNMKNDASYSVSSGVTGVGEITIQGYSSAYGDGGIATIDAGGNAIVPLTQSTNRSVVINIKVKDNGSSGTNTGLVCQYAIGCVAEGIRGHGISATQVALRCEAFNCNTSNTANLAGINVGAAAIGCYSHDHTTGSNCHGFMVGNQTGVLVDCIYDTCGGAGVKKFSTGNLFVVGGNDAYNNTGDGIDITNNSGFAWIENTNLIKNGAYGIHAYGTGYPVFVKNCGFGAGTQANTSGDTTGADIQDLGGTVNYASNTTPYSAPTTGDFRITSASAKGAGYGAFTQTDGTNTGTVAYPDIGAGQHQDSGGGGGATGSRGRLVNAGG